MITKNTFYCCLIFVFSSCKASKENLLIVGADNDKHGCKASAGYQWSELKKECIRSFELPLQLYNEDKTFGAGVLFAKDSSRAEVFCKEGRFILKTKEKFNFKYLFRNGDYFLKKINSNWMFINVNKEMIYN